MTPPSDRLMICRSFHLRLSDGWTILVPAKTREYEWDFSPMPSKKQPSYSIRHGLTRQGQKICAAKSGLRTDEVGVTRSYGNGTEPTRYTGMSVRDSSPGKHHSVCKISLLEGSISV